MWIRPTFRMQAGLECQTRTHPLRAPTPHSRRCVCDAHTKALAAPTCASGAVQCHEPGVGRRRRRHHARRLAGRHFGRQALYQCGAWGAAPHPRQGVQREVRRARCPAGGSRRPTRPLATGSRESGPTHTHRAAPASPSTPAPAPPSLRAAPTRLRSEHIHVPRARQPRRQPQPRAERGRGEREREGNAFSALEHVWQHQRCEAVVYPLQRFEFELEAREERLGGLWCGVVWCGGVRLYLCVARVCDALRAMWTRSAAARTRRSSHAPPAAAAPHLPQRVQLLRRLPPAAAGRARCNEGDARGCAAVSVLRWRLKLLWPRLVGVLQLAGCACPGSCIFCRLSRSARMPPPRRRCS